MSYLRRLTFWRDKRGRKTREREKKREKKIEKKGEKERKREKKGEKTLRLFSSVRLNNYRVSRLFLILSLAGQTNAVYKRGEEEEKNRFFFRPAADEKQIKSHSVQRRKKIIFRLGLISSCRETIFKKMTD